MIRRAFLANFDADEELANPVGYQPSRALKERSRALEGIARQLAGDDAIVAFEPELGSLEGLEGFAFCPTPRALRLLERAGARARAAPTIDVLRAVNHRAFSHALGPTLDGVRIATTRAEIEPFASFPIVMKRPFGFAGRGKRVFHRALDASDWAWIEASLERFGSIAIEPWVDRLADFAMHGYLARGGELTRGEPTIQVVDASGAWIESRRASASDLDESERDALMHEIDRVAEALRRADYFGPFNIDAFRYQDRDRARSLNRRCEINARYSMGYAVGMGERRPDL